MAEAAEQQPEAAPEREATETGEKDEEEKLNPEKLQDDEEPKTLFEKLLHQIPWFRKVEDLRRVWANNWEQNCRFKYANNVIKSTKYNLITFLPLNLFEQFLRIANTYFLILVVLQIIPGVSSVPVYSTLVPLLGVLAVTAVKDAYDDIKRYISDRKINNRPAVIIKHLEKDGTHLCEKQEVRWRQVRVGDILRLESNDFITADLLLLSSSEPNSLVYIETAELDGETNLKVRQPLPETAEMKDDEEYLAHFDGYVECEPPNNRLHKFVGKLQWKRQEESESKEYPLDNDNILLRGCRLRNTEWMYGLVVYAGHDTKLVQNSGKTKFKRTRIDIMMNRMVFLILAFLLFCVLVALVGSLIWEHLTGTGFTVYVPYYGLFTGPTTNAFLQIISNIIVLNTFVPISLYVSVEVIRLGLSLLINWDQEMYYEENDIPAVAKTTTLNEELGQIEYIFSDKTGTLTQNIMTFKKCSINGQKYGETTDGKLNFGLWNHHAEDSFVFHDQALVDKCRSSDPMVSEFFKLIGLCHTVLPNLKEGKLSYNAQSPDEAALVSAARNFGFVFKARTPFAVTIDRIAEDQSGEVEYEVLHILDFNNERKRMSVIVRDPGTQKIVLYCKGADTIIFERLRRDSSALKQTTLCHLGEYAREGLRTLVLAKKDIDQAEYEAWVAEYQTASLLQIDRDVELDKVYSKIEQDLELLGATAIEDKLQDGVPDAIAELANANIKIWVLTGDKQETAINIGYSSRLLKEDMHLFVIDGEEYKQVEKQLRDAKNYIDHVLSNPPEQRARYGSTGDEENIGPPGPPFGIIVNGHSLRHGLKKRMELLLLETASQCKAVICCRVTPLQKKRVVELVKANKKAVTLAIGDGANDVGMIKAAHIGVGISGQEGQQAVLASDFSFGQFRFLKRLLLVHGRWSYHRMTLFLRYFFYKNFAFTFSQFIFAFFCGFTAQTLYNPVYISIYNVVYTCFPVLLLGIFDQDVTAKSCLANPKLYVAGQQNKRFNTFIFLRSLLKGIMAAIFIFFVLFGMTFINVYEEGYEWDYMSFSYAASGSLTLIVNLQLAMDTLYWNPLIHLSVWISILSWLIVPPFMTNVVYFYEQFIDSYYGVGNQVLGSSVFWLYLLLVTFVALAPVVLVRIVTVELSPTLLDDVRLLESHQRSWIKSSVKLIKRITHEDEEETAETSRVSTKSPPAKTVPSRSSYAFSHQEGFADLILTGRWMGAKEEIVASRRLERFATWAGGRPKKKAKSAVDKLSPLALEMPRNGPESVTKSDDGDR